MLAISRFSAKEFPEALRPFEFRLCEARMPLEVHMAVLTREQVRRLDQIATARFGIPGIVLMENAGRGATDHLLRMHPDAPRFLVVAGRGNNGGDGFVIARHLRLRGRGVSVALLGRREDFGLAPDAAANLAILDRMAMPLHPVLTINDLHGLLADQPVVVDAIFGTGLSGDVRGLAREVIALLNASGCPILSVDIPSGLDCDTGLPLGVAIKAAATVTFAAMKLGFTRPGAAVWTGPVHVADIGAPVLPP
jgi:NAD(P)H-hydrate epimerase